MSSYRRWLCIHDEPRPGNLPSLRKRGGFHNVAYREDASNRRVQRTSEDRGKIVAKASFVRFVVESAPERNPSK